MILFMCSLYMNATFKQLFSRRRFFCFLASYSIQNF
jgi:hypothetical protein